MGGNRRSWAAGCHDVSGIKPAFKLKDLSFVSDRPWRRRLREKQKTGNRKASACDFRWHHYHKLHQPWMTGVRDAASNYTSCELRVSHILQTDVPDVNARKTHPHVLEQSRAFWLSTFPVLASPVAVSVSLEL